MKKEFFQAQLKKIEEYTEKGIEFISQRAQMSFEKIGQILKDKIRILKRKSPATPVGEIEVDFETLSKEQKNLDLSGLIMDTDINTKKSILYHPNWPKKIGRSKVLFIPKNNQ